MKTDTKKKKRTIENLLKEIKKKQEEMGKSEVRIFIGHDTSLSEDDLGLLNEKLKKENLKAENDEDRVDEHQEPYVDWTWICFIKITQLQTESWNSVIAKAMVHAGRSGDLEAYDSLSEKLRP